MYPFVCKTEALLTNKRLFGDSEIKYQSINGHHLIPASLRLPNTVKLLRCCLIHLYEERNLVAGTLPMSSHPPTPPGACSGEVQSPTTPLFAAAPQLLVTVTARCSNADVFL